MRCLRSITSLLSVRKIKSTIYHHTIACKQCCDHCSCNILNHRILLCNHHCYQCPDGDQTCFSPLFEKHHTKIDDSCNNKQQRRHKRQQFTSSSSMISVTIKRDRIEKLSTKIIGKKDNGIDQTRNTDPSKVYQEDR